VDVRSEDGRRFRDQTAVLAREPLFVRMAPDVDRFGVHAIVIEYSDQLNISRYRWSRTYTNSTVTLDSGVSTASEEGRTQVTRIEGPHGTSYPGRIL